MLSKGKKYDPIQLDRAVAYKQDVDQVLTNVGADARNSSEEFGADC